MQTYEYIGDYKGYTVEHINSQFRAVAWNGRSPETFYKADRLTDLEKQIDSEDNI